MLVHESLAYNRDKNSTVYITLLDTKKAFDTVSYSGLFWKLFHEGCHLNIWYILWQFYQGFRCTVYMHGTSSDSFEVKQGVHQGAPLSMKLYTIFNNDLLCTLKNLAARVGDIHTTCPAYADDIALVALYKPIMQRLLNLAYEHSRKWSYDFNPSKSVLVLCGRDLSPSTGLYLGEQRLSSVKMEKHLGVPLVADNKALDNMLGDRISRARGTFHASMGIGNCIHPTPPCVTAKLYQTNVMPQLLYGLELIQIPPKCLEKLESTHRYAAKRIQGLPDQAPNPTALTTLGFWTISSVLMMKRLMMLWQILILPMTNIYKRVVIQRFMEHHHGFMVSSKYSASGPVALMYESARILNIHNGVIQDITCGSYMSKTEWKHLVKRHINMREKQVLQASCLLYSRLNVYHKSVNDIRMWPWWTYSLDNPRHTHKCRTLLRLLVNQSSLNRTIDGKEVVINPSCELCGVKCPLTASHVLFECKSIDQSRIQAWLKIANHAPSALWKCMNRMIDNEKTVFILSGFRTNYVKDWFCLYEHVANYVVNMIQLYNEKRKDMQHMAM